MRFFKKSFAVSQLLEFWQPEDEKLKVILDGKVEFSGKLAIVQNSLLRYYCIAKSLARN